MAGGYVGKLLWVDLSKGTLKDEALDEKLCRDFIGGYGIGSKLIYDRMKPGADPLGPENILAFMTGPFTGTPALCGTRFQVLCKSPMTGGWGDGNCGGDFGPFLKFAGYDGVFFTGASDKPVYLLIENGKAELKDAADLWGKDSFYTEDALAERHDKAKVACIGPAGERLSLNAAVMNYKGRAAGRSGVGAVMGSKKLKAVAVVGGGKVPVVDDAGARAIRRQCIKEFDESAVADLFRVTGTAGLTAGSAHDGDSPVKNWGGVGVVDFPDAANLGADVILEQQAEKEGCWHCPLQCGGRMKAPKGEYKYSDGTCKPEYETLCMFGSNCLNSNLDSIIMANEICNRAGLDTISTGASIAFAIECYENGIITKEDTGGIELTWGNHAGIVAMTDLLAKREGFGAILADGTKKASERIGKGSEKYAMNIAGQDFPAHDPKKGFHFATTYRMDATPGRHTQGQEVLNPPGFVADYDESSFSGRGEAHRRGANIMHIINSAGMCEFGFFSLVKIDSIPGFMSAITGWDVTLDELLTTGERISNVRHAFNLREGLNPLDFKFPDRVLGKPAQTEGPLAGITVDDETMAKEYMKTMEWDTETAKPSKERLISLGLDKIASDLWA